jgi:adenylate cyclase
VIGLSIVVSRRISRPLLLLEAEMSRIRNFELDHPLKIFSRVKEVVRMKTAVDNMKGGLRSFRKYVPADLVAELITLGKEAALGAEKREMTVFFSDIEDFTAISEKLTPEALADQMAVYFEGMTRNILQNRGTIDKYIGDAVMAFWGAPAPTPEHALLACRSALACRSFLENLARDAAASGAPVFKTRIGINSGALIVGNMGYQERMNYTVMGDNVNLASRLEGLNKVYGTQILISGNTYALARDGIEARLIDIVAVKGKRQGVPVYELVAEKGSLDSAAKSFLDLFNEGMTCYRERRWSDAIAVFQETGRRNTADKPSLILLERCRDYAAKPPAEDWSGVIALTQK